MGSIYCQHAMQQSYTQMNRSRKTEYFFNRWHCYSFLNDSGEFLSLSIHSTPRVCRPSVCINLQMLPSFGWILKNWHSNVTLFRLNFKNNGLWMVIRYFLVNNGVICHPIAPAVATPCVRLWLPLLFSVPVFGRHSPPVHGPPVH